MLPTSGEQLKLDEMSDMEKDRMIIRLAAEISNQTKQHEQLKIDFEKLKSEAQQRHDELMSTIARLNTESNDTITKLTTTIADLTAQLREHGSNEGPRRKTANRPTKLGNTVSSEAMDTTSSTHTGNTNGKGQLANPENRLLGFANCAMRHASSCGDLNQFGMNGDVNDENLFDNFVTSSPGNDNAAAKFGGSHELSPIAMLPPPPRNMIHTNPTTSSGSSYSFATNHRNATNVNEIPKSGNKQAPPTFATVTAMNSNSNARSTTSSSKTNSTGSNNTTGTNVREPRPSPIQLGKMDRTTYGLVLDRLRNTFKSGEFVWQHSNAGGLPRIFASNIDIKQRIQALLFESHYEFNTYSERATKRKAFLVRGIGYGNDDSCIHDITETLRAAGISGQIEVSRFFTPFMKRNHGSESAPIFQIIAPHDVSDQAIADINQIGCFRVRIQRMKPSSVIQCHRCQQFGHTSSNCSFLYRCVQCTGAHNPGCCPRNTNKQLPIECINCKAGGLNEFNHTANDLRNCQYYANIESSRDRIKNAVSKKIADHTPKRTVSAPSQPKPVGIVESVVANNPHDRKKSGKSNKKRNGSTKPNELRADLGVSSTQTVSVQKNRVNNGERAKSNGDVSNLIAALMQVLVSFQ